MFGRSRQQFSHRKNLSGISPAGISPRSRQWRAGLCRWCDLQSTTFGTTDGVTIPHIGGKPALVSARPGIHRHQRFARHLHRCACPTVAAVLSKSIHDDLRRIAARSDQLVSVFQHSPSNAVATTRILRRALMVRFGILKSALHGGGIIAPNTGIASPLQLADLATGTVTYYLNGTPVFTGNAPLDDRHAITPTRIPARTSCAVQRRRYVRHLYAWFT